MLAIACYEVTKVFNDGKWWSRNKKIVKAVDNITFEVEKGEIFGILGPNGSGKSTIIRMLSTLLLPDSGKITIFGYDIIKHSMLIRSFINRVSVDAAFFKKLSSLENLYYAARLYGLNPAEEKERMLGILEKLGFAKDKINESIQDLSRGMQQKVAIARAFLTTPPILLLDEPTTGLDPVSKRDVQCFIQEIKQKHDTTIILTTHDMMEADNLCKRVAIINEGKIVALDKPKALKAKVGNGDKDKIISLEHVFFELTGRKFKEELNYAE